MVPRQQSSLSTSAAVRNDVTDCRLTAERSNQLDVPSQRLRSVPPLVREAGALRLDLACFRGSATFAFVTARRRASGAGHSIAVRPLDEMCRATVKRSRIDGAQATMLA